MSCNTESTQIGDREYSATQWPAEKSLLMKFKLVKMFAAPLTLLIDGINLDSDPKAEAKEDEAGAISKSLVLMFENSDPEDVVAIIKDVVIGTAVGDTKITHAKFNSLFSGDDLLEAYKVFIFVLKVNYSNLFKGQLAGNLLAKVTGNL